jgi:hypothetical protein
MKSAPQMEITVGLTAAPSRKPYANARQSTRVPLTIRCRFEVMLFRFIPPLGGRGPVCTG